MKTTFQDGVGLLDTDSERSKRVKHTHPSAPTAPYPHNAGSNASASPSIRSVANNPNSFDVRNSSGSVDAKLLAALQGTNRSSLSASQSVSLSSAAAPLPSLEVRAQQDLLRTLLLRQQMNNVPASAPVAARGNDLQERLLAQLAASANNRQQWQLEGQNLNANAISSLGNTDLLTRAAVLSGMGLSQSSAGGVSSGQTGSSTTSSDANRLIEHLLAAQRRQVSNHGQLSNLEAQIAAATGLSTAARPPQGNSIDSFQLQNYLNQQQKTNEAKSGFPSELLRPPQGNSIETYQLQNYLNQQQRTNESNSGLSSELFGQLQRNQQQQFMLSTSMGASLPDSVLRPMMNPEHNSANSLQTSALEERIRALRAGLVDNKTPNASSSAALAKLDPTANAAYPTTSYEGDRLTPVALPSEQWVMSEYQCLLRQQIVFVEASANENCGKTQGRNKPIVAGQVGILCRHCARVPARNRPRGAVYFPAMLHRIYQAAQNMAHNHFAGSCQAIPEETRQRLLLLKEQKVVTVGAGKEYWVSAASTVGVQEGQDFLFFDKSVGKDGTVKQPPATAIAAAAPRAGSEAHPDTSPKEGCGTTNRST